MIPSQRTPHQQMIDALLVERFGSPVVHDWHPEQEPAVAVYQRALDAGLIPDVLVVEAS